MGNNIGGRTKKAKVMKINGETMKLKTPIQAREVIKDYPDHVVLDSEAVKHFGVRAKPLEPQQHLQPKKTYFLVQLPKFDPLDHDHQENKYVPRRVKSGIHMGAKDRLELLMLSRRAVSDLSSSTAVSASGGGAAGPMRVKMRLPKAQLERLLEESKDEVEVAEKIADLYVEKSGGGTATAAGHHGRTYSKAREKRVSFAATDEEGIHLDERPLCSNSEKISYTSSEATRIPSL
ncbi:hypothetical protein JRO89_XS11G0016100 [Xanthoceras sorbifolium]|uniref:Plastid movement impaired 2 n=1 Tax=Xanthoceras sorbifolium TaxID=99658 RepID=A0ABQ8HE89_9ROSI|nr:hypothetical protein JRO89_XS11G0016100 [Xanthoceras sorbifolium]